MGTSVYMIDRTYGHLAANADDHERELLDAFDRNGEGSEEKSISTPTDTDKGG